MCSSFFVQLMTIKKNIRLSHAVTDKWLENCTALRCMIYGRMVIKISKVGWKFSIIQVFLHIHSISTAFCNSSSIWCYRNNVGRFEKKTSFYFFHSGNFKLKTFKRDGIAQCVRLKIDQTDPIPFRLFKRLNRQ